MTYYFIALFILFVTFMVTGLPCLLIPQRTISFVVGQLSNASCWSGSQSAAPPVPGDDSAICIRVLGLVLVSLSVILGLIILEAVGL